METAKPKIIKKESRTDHEIKKRRANITLVRLLIEELNKDDAREILYSLRKKAA